jgi:hypothetical protein
MATAIAVDTKAITKVCPLCSEEYPGEDVYCGKDGTLLVNSDSRVLSSGTLDNR